MSGIDDHFEDIVLPALREYVEAERRLTGAVTAGVPSEIEAARKLAMRRARTGSIELHQLADYAANLASPPSNAGLIRATVQQSCVFLRQSASIDDVDLLRDVAEAFKHHTLDRKTAAVTGANAMIASATGYSMLHFGEGKFGGTEQVVVTRRDGKQRAMSSILQNATDAWRKHLGRSLPPIGDCTT